VDNPEVGSRLREVYWRPGNAEAFLDLVEKLTGKALTGKSEALYRCSFDRCDSGHCCVVYKVHNLTCLQYRQRRGLSGPLHKLPGKALTGKLSVKQCTVTLLYFFGLCLYATYRFFFTLHQSQTWLPYVFVMRVKMWPWLKTGRS
jgi:hypothetical protein